MKPELQNSLLELVLVSIELRTVAAQSKHHRSDKGSVALRHLKFSILQELLPLNFRINFSVRKLESEEAFTTDNSNVSPHNRKKKVKKYDGDLLCKVSFW